MPKLNVISTVPLPDPQRVVCNRLSISFCPVVEIDEVVNPDVGPPSTGDGESPPSAA